MPQLNDQFFPVLPVTGKVLDMGAGNGKWSMAFKKMGYAVVAIDLKDRPENVPDDIEWIKSDLHDALPKLAEGSFAAVYMRNVIQFLPREQFTKKLLPWAKALLAADGVLGVETFFGLIEPPPGPQPHPAYYTAEDLKRLCADMDIVWCEQFKDDLKDLEGTVRKFSMTQLVAKKRSAQ